MHHKRTGPKSTRGGCLLCKPHKHQAAKDTLAAQTRQEQIARISEAEMLGRDRDLPDFAKVRDTWQGLPCPEGEHAWGPSDLEGADLVRCRVCGEDGYRDAEGHIT